MDVECSPSTDPAQEERPTQLSAHLSWLFAKGCFKVTVVERRNQPFLVFLSKGRISERWMVEARHPECLLLPVVEVS